MNIRKKITILGGEAPYNVHIVNVDQCPCVVLDSSFPRSFGGGELEINLEYDTTVNEDCINCPIEVVVTDNKGCVTRQYLNINVQGQVYVNSCGCRVRVTECDLVPGQELRFNLDNCLQVDINELDRTSFNLIKGSFIPNSSIIYDGLTNDIVYTVGDTVKGIDLIEFSMSTNTGIITPTIEFFINLNCIEPIELNTERTFVECNTTTLIDVLANDVILPSPDYSTFEIVQQGQYGTASIVDNKVQYVSQNVNQKTDQVTYKICDTNGQCSEQIIYIIIECFSCDITSSSSTAMCDFTISLEHPDTGQLDYAKVEMLPNESKIRVTGRYYVDNICGEDRIGGSIVNYTFYNGALWGGNAHYASYSFGGYISGTCPNMVQGGFVKTIRLYDTISNQPKNLNLNPNTTPYLTGCAGTLTQAELLYNPNDLTTYMANLNKLIQNAICVEYNTTNTSGYYLKLLEHGGTTKGVTMEFYSKHQPSGLWIGINKNDRNLEYSTNGTDSIIRGTDVVEDCHLYPTFNAAIRKDFKTRCGNTITWFKRNISTAIIDILNSNYNLVTLNVTKVHLDDAITSHNPTTQCSSTEIVLSVHCSKCTTPITYLWSNGETTSTIKVPFNSGTYTVQVICDGYTSTYQYSTNGE